MTERKKFEHISSRPVPYTTKTGIQIGCHYQPPLQKLTRDGEYIQGVLLGIRTSIIPTRRTVGMTAYMVAMISMLVALVLVNVK